MKNEGSCAAFEKLIALYVECDLRENERRRVEAHVEVCPNCRDLAGDLRQSQAIAKTLRLDTVNSTAMADLRQRVLNEVGDLEPAPAWVLAIHQLIFTGLRGKATIAGIALVGMITGGVWYWQARTVIAPRGSLAVDVARVEASPSLDSESVSEMPNPPMEVHRKSGRVNRLKVSTEEVPATEATIDPITPAVELAVIPIKFVTDDPDIIIYWLPNDKGD